MDFEQLGNKSALVEARLGIMEMIALIFSRLNQPPFNKGYASMSELDGKRPMQLLDLLCEVIGEVNPDERTILEEPTDIRVERIIGFLAVMKFNIPDEEQFRQSLLTGDKDTITIVLHDILQSFDRYKKRAYLAKYLMPMDIPPEFRNEDLVLDLEARLKDMQREFKETHMEVEKVRAQHGGARPVDLKAEISQLEAERSQLQMKIQRLRKEKESLGDDSYFQDMLRVTSNLRKEQEEEVRVMERMRENRQALQAAEVRYTDSNKRLAEARQTGAGNQSAEQILAKLERDVRELNARRDSIESALLEREQYMERMMGWEQSDRVLTADDVREKRIHVEELEREVKSLSDRLDSALERNSKLVVFRQASTMAQRKLREKEDDLERLEDERRRLTRNLEEKEAQAHARGETPNRLGKMDLKRYGAVVRDKIEKYRKMREELSALRAELVVLQRTEQILKGRHKNLDSVLEDLERRKGVEGYRDTQKALVDMSEKAAEVDQMKGATLEEISTMVEQISREFRQKQTQLQPLMSKLKSVRHEYMEVEADFNEKKGSFDKIAVGLEMEKSVLERDCDTYQEECLREESRYHYLNCLVTIAKTKLDRAEKEKKCQSGDSTRIMRDFASFKELYGHKITQQEQLTKQLRRQQKELKETAGAMTNQKSNFRDLQRLLDAKSKALSAGDGMGSPVGSSGIRFESEAKSGGNYMTME